MASTLELDRVTVPSQQAEAADDASLLRAFVRGSEDGERAFGELVRRHGPMVYGLCRRRLRDLAAAEDATQAVFVLLARKASGLHAKPSLAGWLYRTAELVVRTMQRARKNRAHHERLAGQAARRSESGARDLEPLRARLHDGLQQLKEADREAIVVHYLEGVAQDEASARLGIGYDAFRQRLARAMDRLRGVLGTRGAVFSVAALGAALARVADADAQAWPGALEQTCSNAGLNAGALSPAVARIVKGALETMTSKKPFILAGALAVAVLCGGAFLWGGENQPEKESQPVRKPDGGSAPKDAQTLAQGLDATHLMLAQIKAVGKPVFSPDGRWLAVYEEDGGLTLTDVADALKGGAAYQPKRFKTAPLPRNASQIVGAAASFSADSKRMVFRGPDDILLLELPPESEPKPLGLGKNCHPALETSRAQTEGPASKREDTWVFFNSGRLLLYRVREKAAQIEGPEVRTNGLQWNADRSALLATLKDGSAAVVNLSSGKVERLLDIAAFEKEIGKPFASAAATAQHGARILVEGTRLYPPQMRGMFGTYVPDGDEAPERGRNPGSAEPGPPMPRYFYVYEGSNRQKIWMASVARWLDTQWVLPSKKLDRYFYFQVANAGGAGHGVPHAWLGHLDAHGKRTEKDLGNPFGAQTDAPLFEVLDLAPDAGKALVLMRSMRERTFSKNFDAESMKEIMKMLPNAAHRDGQDAAIKMLAGAMLFHKYQRAGGSYEGENVIMHFHTWSLWVLDAEKGEVRRLGPEFGEAIGELKDVTAAPGSPQRDGSSAAAYSTQAGLTAVPLSGYTMNPGIFSEARGLMLIKVPAWE